MFFAVESGVQFCLLTICLAPPTTPAVLPTNDPLPKNGVVLDDIGCCAETAEGGGGAGGGVLEEAAATAAAMFGNKGFGLD